jgi:hypothetical protein
MQLLASIKNGLKFFQRKELMRIIMIAEEEVTHEVLAGLNNNFFVSRLRRSFHVLLDLGVYALATISEVAYLDWVAVVAQMNACTLSGVIAVDVEDFGVAWGNARGRLLTNSTHESGAQRQETTKGNGFFCEAVKISIIDRGGAMSTLEVITKKILALEMANARSGAKNNAHVIGDIGGLDFGSDITVIAFVHAIQGFGLCMRGREAYWGKTNIRFPSKRGGRKLTFSICKVS